MQRFQCFSGKTEAGRNRDQWQGFRLQSATTYSKLPLFCMVVYIETHKTDIKQGIVCIYQDKNGCQSEIVFGAGSDEEGPAKTNRYYLYNFASKT